VQIRPRWAQSTSHISVEYLDERIKEMLTCSMRSKSFFTPSPGASVTGPAPNDLERVSNPERMLV
jgi:hypothetical protein